MLCIKCVLSIYYLKCSVLEIMKNINKYYVVFLM